MKKLNYNNQCNTTKSFSLNKFFVPYNIIINVILYFRSVRKDWKYHINYANYVLRK